jgi:hypothetical protein
MVAFDPGVVCISALLSTAGLLECPWARYWTQSTFVLRNSTTCLLSQCLVRCQLWLLSGVIRLMDCREMAPQGTSRQCTRLTFPYLELLSWRRLPSQPAHLKVSYPIGRVASSAFATWTGVELGSWQLCQDATLSQPSNYSQSHRAGEATDWHELSGIGYSCWSCRPSSSYMPANHSWSIVTYSDWTSSVVTPSPSSFNLPNSKSPSIKSIAGAPSLVASLIASFVKLPVVISSPLSARPTMAPRKSRT